MYLNCYYFLFDDANVVLLFDFCNTVFTFNVNLTFDLRITKMI